MEMMKHLRIILAITIIVGWYGPNMVIASAETEFRPATYPLGGFPRATSLVDIDRDSDLDIFVTNPEKHNITLFINNGDGTFEVGGNYPVEGYPIAILSIDIDNDSDIDLAVLDSDGRVRIFKQGEEGENAHKGIHYEPAGAYRAEPYSFHISPYDADNDGDTDLIVQAARITNVLLNDGKGGFDTTLAWPGPVTSHIRITADLNLDERDDMVIGDMEGVSVLLNNGNNTFAKGVGYSTGKKPMAVASGDLDGDGDDDLIVANYKGNTISILKNKGDGTFGEAVNYPAAKGPNSISLGDIDMDEDLDIVVTNGISGELSLFFNNMVQHLTLSTESLPQGLKGLYYEAGLEAKGGVPPYKWDVVSGSLPPSIELDPVTGELISKSRHGEEGGEAEEENSGEPLPGREPPCLCLQAPLGLYRFTVQVTDSASAAATANLHIEVLPQDGMISGTVRYSGEKEGTIRIGLLLAPQPPQTPQLSLTGLSRFFYSTTITSPGEYKIVDIYPESSYLIAAYLDMNGDGIRQIDEPWGAYRKPDSSEEADTVMVDNGAEISEIDIELVDNRQ